MLKYEVQHDRVLSPLLDDGQPDIAGYNTELAARGNPTWHHVSWLFSECYLYRRVHTFFGLTTHWKNYDVFARSKASTFRSSRSAVLELAARSRQVHSQLGNSEKASGSEEREAAEQLLFAEMCEICLWGNATDLSLLTSLSYEDIQKLQGAEAQKTRQKSIVVNQLPDAYRVLKQAKLERPNASRRVDIILDNAGFELFVDLLLAAYLLSTQLATEVVLHPKSLPWFVSDVVPQDLANLLNALADPVAFYRMTADDAQDQPPPVEITADESADLAFLFQQWSGFHQDGRLRLRPNRFWTQAGSYWRLPREAPALLDDLRASELVIFKGDLNYRKLTGDAMWDPHTPFAEATGPLGKGSGVRTLTLRTCKADTVVGLPEGEDARLRATEGGGGDSGARKWAWSGKWALVQFCDGKT